MKVNLRRIVEQAVVEAVDTTMGGDENDRRARMASELEKRYNVPRRNSNEWSGLAQREMDEDDEEKTEDDEDDEKLFSDAPLEIGADEEEDTDEETAAELPELTADDVTNPRLDTLVKYLNLMRSGKSLKDKDASENLKSYFESLSTGEKQALVVYAHGLMQILAGGTGGDDATRPSKQGIRTSETADEKATEKQSSDRQREPVKPEATAKIARQPAETQVEPAAKMSPGGPIVVGESKAVRELLNRSRL